MNQNLTVSFKFSRCIAENSNHAWRLFVSARLIIMVNAIKLINAVKHVATLSLRLMDSQKIITNKFVEWHKNNILELGAPL